MLARLLPGPRRTSRRLPGVHTKQKQLFIANYWQIYGCFSRFVYKGKKWRRQKNRREAAPALDRPFFVYFGKNGL